MGRLSSFAGWAALLYDQKSTSNQQGIAVDGHGGARPNSGGKRPGAGRKRKPVADWQMRNLLVLQSVFTEDDVKVIAESLRSDMRSGDKDARKVAMAYLYGAPPKEVTLKGDEAAPLRIVIEGD